MLLLVSICGYILVVIKEKLYLRKNIILLDKKSVTQKHINEADIKEFLLDGNRLKTGDEVKVILKNKNTISGVIIGAIKKENQLLIVTHNDEVRKFSIGIIKQIKVVSRYGKFF
ncbi:hypothetical protein [Abyssisolibacter fermentans]|uniref:hypothetical protein n=1 Tax=Abyssisolibacter fermentans TaxID=1766203 RepID=UPI001FA6DCF9|nr:hypothetical protein [Abyssisolibacter fermentans]